MRSLLVFLFLTWASSVFADIYQSGDLKVESLRVASNGVYVRFNPALDACEGGDQYRMHALLPTSNGNYEMLASTLLAAYSADLSIKYVFASNEGQPCSATHILNLTMIEFKEK